MITLDHVSKRYGDKIAVDDLSMEIAAGEIAVLLGPSGCGKTTTLRAINRMLDIDSGRVLIDGQDVSQRSPDELRRHIGYVIQSIGLFPHMTDARKVGTVPRLLGWDAKRIAARTTELLELVGLDPATYAQKRPAQLSGGEQQRVGVARALAADPSVLLMDEPFGALDPLSRQRLQVEFRNLQRTLGTTVVFVTHDVEEAVILGDRVALMHDGRLVQFDRPEVLWQHPAEKFVSDFFGEELSLKILSRHAASSAVIAPGDGDGLPHVPASATLKDALAAMVSAGTQAVHVAGEGAHPAGVLTFEALIDSVRVES